MDELNLIDYELSKRLSLMDLPFNALIAAAARKADTENTLRLKSVFPDLMHDLQRRYNAPAGMLPEDGITNPDETLGRLQEIVASYMGEL